MNQELVMVTEEKQILTNVQVLEQSLKSFSYYLVNNIEVNLNYCLNILEERNLTKQSNSKAATAAASMVSVIPYVGKGVAEAIKEGELYILNDIDKNKARKLAGLVYFYGDNQDRVRKILIESAIEIFYCYEHQFMNIINKNGLINAMHKFAIDAGYRIFNYLLKIKANQNITINQVTQGVVKGVSMKNNYGKQAGRIIKDNDKTWHTASFYDKCGLFFENEEHFYETKNSKTEKYGYRRVFIWENFDDIVGEISPVKEVKQDYIQDKIAYIKLHNDIKKYIMTKTPEDNAKLDRELKYNKSKTDSHINHEVLIELFEMQHQKQLEYLEDSFKELIQQQKDNNEMVNKIGEKQVSLEHHTKMNEKLNDIYQEIIRSKDGQMTLLELFKDYVNGMEETKISLKLLFESWAANADYYKLMEMESKMKLHTPSPKSYMNIISSALKKKVDTFDDIL